MVQYTAVTYILSTVPNLYISRTFSLHATLLMVTKQCCRMLITPLSKHFSGVKRPYVIVFRN